jgi:hypothetical protein
MAAVRKQHLAFGLTAITNEALGLGIRNSSWRPCTPTTNITGNICRINNCKNGDGAKFKAVRICISANYAHK